MDHNKKISQRFWNLPDKGELESAREHTFIDDIVQKAHIEKELLSNLNGIKTVFDAGAGCGRFSILLAKHGIHVTHFDISRSMLDKAYRLASNADVLDNITFVEGALEDLSDFDDKGFDMVISFDSPISYTYPRHEEVIKDLVRIAGKKIIISVTSRLGSLPYMANPIQKNQFILDENCSDPWVKWYLLNKESAIQAFNFKKIYCEELWEKGITCDIQEIASEYEKGGSPWPVTYCFMPDELKDILEKYGVKNIRLAGPGAFARTIPNELLVKIMKDEDQKKEFLDFCYKYDSNLFVCGMGKDNLFAKGDILDDQRKI